MSIRLFCYPPPAVLKYTSEQIMIFNDIFNKILIYNKMMFLEFYLSVLILRNMTYLLQK